MSQFEACRRTNEHDLPKPDQIEHEWVVTRNNYIQGDFHFPDTKEGERCARSVANLLNSVYEEGQRFIVNQQREILGLRPVT